MKIAHKSYMFPYGKTFMDVPVGFAVNQSNFLRVYKATPPVSVFIARKKP